ncbi:receptor-like cytosolic serine/threonine-protein kinase RBK2 [Juglans microcarpa x Juglans regia]|uniref:receptor-like cytosolic serine/threonine-protein kinase RBK2 n=1 Tax=Juglans microcarpa x Juglans regia TaxID=2249226 RepID=UPI001B7E0CD6|nr:receptor-like cytosolic serine/threonine-protein kinase RBK2 [Juglans microcarpa x Juglans regia]XP_041020133.1 receptor-like cytosolic serine/threonine-protein kinase RBK2 [Juglans microcarpa x Juglans regia]XP_041020134.1 receptor-like cytosolic serine/threonine-protein kinase RBK2 [Juglans microcarpa x Juglans regia]
MKKKVDSSSPVGVLEDYFKSSESETCSSKELAIVSKNSKPVSGWRGFVQLLRNRSKKSLDTLHPLSVTKLSRRMSGSMREAMSMVPFFRVHPDLTYTNLPWKNFSLYELQTATNYFSHENLIGKGGYAEVYKGCLRDGQLVAIKRLTKGKADEIVADFLSELGVMAHVNHPNTAKLIGYGVEGGMHLVLELSPHGSLASLLYGSKEKLEWGIRYKIALGTAKGLLYLHEGCQRRIIHRDIKASNILLTGDFEPQICDFGLAKWLPEQWTHHIVSKFEGTFGYLAPEYLLHGIVDEKTDVFAFGVLLLEIVTGRRALDYSQQSLVLWAKPLIKKNHINELIDPSLGDNYNSPQINLVLLVASLCIQQSSIRRPCMSQVLQLLSGDLSCLKCMRKSRTEFFRKAFHEEFINAEECYATKI